MAKNTNAAEKDNTKRFKVKKPVTLPLLKLEKGVPIYCTINEEMYIGKGNTKKDMAPPTLLNITNLETGEMAEIIVPAVLGSIFTEHYPEASYVGLSFEIEKTTNPTEGGARYSKFRVSELEV